VLAPHTNGPRDFAPVWCSEFTIKAATLQEDSSDFAARLIVKFRDQTDCAVVVVQPSPLEQIGQSETSKGPLRIFV
jgi:hypothetical protein